MSTGTYFGQPDDENDDDRRHRMTPFEAFQYGTAVVIRLLILVAIAAAVGVLVYWLNL